MSQYFLSNAVQRENYYSDFFQHSPDIFFRIDFDEPVALTNDFQDFYQDFLQEAFIGEFNPAFSELNLLSQTDDNHDLHLKSQKNLLSFISEIVIQEFFEANCLIDEIVLENDDLKFLKTSLIGVVKNDRLHCIWCKIRDVTAEVIFQKNSADEERSVRLTQKIEALGRLAGGIAHDFNNFLAVIMLQNDLLNLQLPAGNPLRHRTEEMKQATAKAAAMVKQLLAVGRKQPLDPKPTEINLLIKEFAKNFSSVLPDNISIELNLSHDSGICFIDQQQTLQAMTSLAQNAVEAMPEGGKITIETSNISLDKTSILHRSQPEGSFVQISIQDNGSGMDAPTLESIFEPFFSNKKSSKSVGLGLATVYGFVKQSKGFIWVESEIERGTTFKVQFPRIDQPIEI